MIQNKKIVVVDDDVKVITLLDNVLTRSGYQVFIAVEGKKALELVKQEKPALLITDILQPGLDGAQLCHQVKNDPELGNTKVIIMTGIYNEISFRLQMDSSYDAFIEKPIDINKLADLVKEKIGKF